MQVNILESVATFTFVLGKTIADNAAVYTMIAESALIDMVCDALTRNIPSHVPEEEMQFSQPDQVDGQQLLSLMAALLHPSGDAPPSYPYRQSQMITSQRGFTQHRVKTCLESSIKRLNHISFMIDFSGTSMMVTTFLLSST